MIPEKIKFGCLTKKGMAEVHERSLPQLKADELLVKQEVCNICTTDYQQWQGLREHQGYPMAGGHECSGIVVDKGSDIGNTFEVGDRVSILYDYCGICSQCKMGEITNCENIKMFGKNYSNEYYGLFGFATYFIRKAKSFVKMNPKLRPEEAAFVEPLGSVLQNMKKLRLRPGKDTVVVIGAGTMGLLNAAVARAMGGRVIVSEMMDKKIDISRRMGFEVINAKEEDPVEKVMEFTNDLGADVVILAVGATAANNQALKMIKKRDAKISLFAAGYPAPQMDIDPNMIHYKKIEVIGTFGSSLEDYNDAAGMLNEKRIDVSLLIEERISLDKIQEAFEKANSNNYRISVMLQQKTV
ncbi:zinc-dependent alcohol dehydrogenase [Pectinatus haikarae]|uniref:L-iditol 2-dehydrogenase n=1 Tax=Pectinatus haikarae TaxID=349096 RepID=A0ABT9Y4Y3_9FIRM|nr:zinc-binding dehydrogenase [Pectinatus haikarae]MDQ0202885.1 L-iditol 2-dehydrogenase [Pectinatus haikarae]